MPFEIATLLSGIRTADSLLNRVLPKKGTRIQNKIDAVESLQRAINATQIYLIEKNNVYAPDLNLSNLWLNAFSAMVKIDKQLAGRLRQKSKFWSNPQSWLREESTMTMIPDLKELGDKCDSIMVELEKRSN